MNNNNNNNVKNIAYFRREYKKGRLRRKNLPNNPLLLFEKWLQEACMAQLPDSTAMILATVDSSGQPYQRTVLLKNYDKKNMIFYTNLSSRKALHLKNNPRVSLHFPWHFLDRQVIILGKVEKLSQLENLEYFRSRPRNSQISAWASKQSNFISSYSLLEEKFFTLKQKFQQSEVPLPNFWGGFRVKYYSVEFWQGGKNRMHDRFLYQLNENGNWLINRLAP